MKSARVRRLSQFSIRTFLALIAIVALWLALWTIHAQHQRRVVESVVRSGGEVFYDYQWASADPASERPPRSVWLRKLMGNDYFDDVVSISIPGERVTGNDRQSLIEDAGKLKQLRVFTFRDADNRVLEAVGHHLQHLRELYVPGEKVDDAGLVLCSNSILGLGSLDFRVNAFEFVSSVIQPHLPIDGSLLDADIAGPGFRLSL
jgi:hypothetical protein